MVTISPKIWFLRKVDEMKCTYVVDFLNELVVQCDSII